MVVHAAVLVPSNYALVQDAMDCIADWSSNYNVTTVSILECLLDTIEMDLETARNYVERKEIDMMSVINGTAAHTDVINDLISRVALLDKYMLVREYIVLPLARSLHIGRFLSLSERGSIYEIKYIPCAGVDLPNIPRNGY